MNEKNTTAPESRVWHSLAPEALESALRTSSDRGLSFGDAIERMERYGANTFERGKQSTLVEKILKQFKSPLIIILLGAGGITFFLKEYIDFTVILIATLVNVAIGAFQEERASQAFKRLKDSQERFAKVLRDGRIVSLPAEDIVPGDIVLIEAGGVVPADIRLIRTNNLSINEAALTGEWVEVAKDTGVHQAEIPLVERSNMGWMGTSVVGGSGRGIVVATGSRTEVGKIAESLSYVEERETPIQKNIAVLARFLIYVVVAAIVLIFLLGIVRGEALTEMLLIAIAVAVAVVPEGLPAAVTVVLALGMERILKHGGLVRNLLAAETLGSTTVIVTDKTGTLTEGRMTLEALVPLGVIKGGTEDEYSDDINKLLHNAMRASDAGIEFDPETKKERISGRPIERAIAEYGATHNYGIEQLQQQERKLDFHAFDSRRPFATALVLHSGGKHTIAFSGAPELLLENAAYYLEQGTYKKVTEEVRKTFREYQVALSREGKRLIAIALREADEGVLNRKAPAQEALADSVFLGFVAFSDPARKDVPAAIATAQSAGARILMVTGDNPETARRIALDVGIITDFENARALTGSDIEQMDDHELSLALEEVRVFARILPNQKMRIVSLLKDAGEVVAMTGDGINDAPALQSADIGIAVGSGTEVAKEASDLILINNSFSIIVRAIEEGRKIINNLKKIIAYLLSTSFGEVYLVIGALILGGPLPILPTQVLWLNIIGNGLMSFAFAFEPGSSDAMRQKPSAHSAAHIITPPVRKMILLITMVTGIFLVTLYAILLRFNVPIETIRTMLFVALTLDTFFFTFSLKDFYRPVWRVSFWSNRYLIFAIIISAFLLTATFFIPVLSELVSVVALSPQAIVLLVGVGLFNLIVIEMAKYLFFKKERAEMSIV